MIDVALLGIIRRWHIRDQVPLREIARRLGISRNTVRRYLRTEITEPSYAERRSPSAIDKYAFQLSALLKTEAAKSRKQRRTLKQIHEGLKKLGFEGSYDRVAAFARIWRAGQTDRVNSANKRTVLVRNVCEALVDDVDIDAFAICLIQLLEALLGFFRIRVQTFTVERVDVFFVSGVSRGAHTKTQLL